MKTWIDLTDRFPMTFDVDRMRQEYDVIKDENWLNHYDSTLSRDWKALLLVSIHGEMFDAESQRGSNDYSIMQRTPLVQKMPYFESILNAFKTQQGRVRILKLSPGAGIALHRDIGYEAANFAVGQVRLHIPIYTNDKVVFFVGGEEIKMKPGRLYYVNFDKPHYVSNKGNSDRLHLVLDLQVNDWLRAVFPSMSLFEQIESRFMSIFLPFQWRLIKAKRKLMTLFWRYYTGSILQKLKHHFIKRKY